MVKTKSFIKPIIIVAGVTILSSTMGAYYWKQGNRPPILEIYVFTLKSGRSLFIRTPEDKRILVDGGSNSEVIRHISEILPFYSRRIDTIFATNNVGKNIGGLIDIVQRYQVDSVYLPKHALDILGLASSTDQIYETFMQAINEKQLTQNLIARGQIVDLDSKTRLEVLFPADPIDFMYSKTSSPEVLFNISYGNNNIIFAGNATAKVQKYIASTTASATKNASFIKTDVLIVSHSALPQSMAPQFAEKFYPKYLVYSKNIPKSDIEKDDSSIFESSSQSLSQSSLKPNSSSATKTKPKKDPFDYLSSEDRFNIKEGSGVKIVSDGISVTITHF